MDLVIRAAVIFCFIFLLTRIVGRRQLSDLEPFDLILLVVIGDLVQQGITQNDESVTGAATVIATIALLSVAVSWLSFRFKSLRPITEGEPMILVEDGRPIEANMRRERITMDDLQETIREAELSSVSEVKWAILENDGKISCIKRDSG